MEKLENCIILPALVSDGMVLQRNTQIRIWGKAAPGEELTLNFRNGLYRTETGENGAWEIRLDSPEAGGPYEMVFRCGGSEKILQNIMVGDVWVLGGQSNMQISVRRTLDLFAREVKGVDFPAIRQFIVPQVYDFHGCREDLPGGSWVPVTPDSVYDFSAIGYFFARKLYDKYSIPIGLILSAIGGTPAESWISEKTLMRFGKFQEPLAFCKDDSYVNGTIQREEMQNNCWYRELTETDAGLKDEVCPWFSDECDTAGWKEIEIPFPFEGTELEEVKGGAVWFRKEIDLSANMLEGKGKLVLGTIIDADDTYVNGVRVGGTGYLYPPRRYDIPEGLLREGKNTITVRLVVTRNTGAFVTDMPYVLRVNGEELPLFGIWKYKVGAVIKAQLPTTFFQYKPTGLYNGMIYPLRKYMIRGVLWYQGESNTDYPYDYKDLFESVIRDWRETWNIGEFPFLYVQLANYCPWKKEPDISGWARLREEQRKVLEVPGTGMVVTVDKGMYNDLHPWDKKSVGERLALWAFKMVFHEDIVCSGPIYKSMEKKGRTIILHFDYTGSGLMAEGGVLNSFEACGADGFFYPVEATIDKDTVIVTGNRAEDPVHVRYGWADNPESANLYNREGLPASPFTTRS